MKNRSRRDILFIVTYTCMVGIRGGITQEEQVRIKDLSSKIAESWQASVRATLSEFPVTILTVGASDDTMSNSSWDVPSASMVDGTLSRGNIGQFSRIFARSLQSTVELALTTGLDGLRQCDSRTLKLLTQYEGILSDLSAQGVSHPESEYYRRVSRLFEEIAGSGAISEFHKKLVKGVEGKAASNQGQQATGSQDGPASITPQDHFLSTARGASTCSNGTDIQSLSSSGSEASSDPEICMNDARKVVIDALRASWTRDSSPETQVRVILGLGQASETIMSDLGKIEPLLETAFWNYSIGKPSYRAGFKVDPFSFELGLPDASKVRSDSGDEIGASVNLLKVAPFAAAIYEADPEKDPDARTLHFRSIELEASIAILTNKDFLKWIAEKYPDIGPDDLRDSSGKSIEKQVQPLDRFEKLVELILGAANTPDDVNVSGEIFQIADKHKDELAQSLYTNGFIAKVRTNIRDVHGEAGKPEAVELRIITPKGGYGTGRETFSSLQSKFSSLGKKNGATAAKKAEILQREKDLLMQMIKGTFDELENKLTKLVKHRLENGPNVPLAGCAKKA